VTYFSLAFIANETIQGSWKFQENGKIIPCYLEKELTIFAKNLRFLRKKIGFTLAEIEDRTGFKVSTWSSYENANSEPDFNTLINISKFLGITIDDILLKDLQNVHLLAGNGDAEGKQRSTSKSAGKSASKPIIYETYEGQKLELNLDSNNKEWVLARMILDNGRKLDQLLIIAKKQSNK
jgi:transcriptional regulator with XRE-family HTH domain